MAWQGRQKDLESGSAAARLYTVLLLALVLEAFALAAPLFMQLVVDCAVVSNDGDLLSLLAIGLLPRGLIRVGVSTLRVWVVMVLNNQLILQRLANLFRHLDDIVSRFDPMGRLSAR